ncbi:hypothetical protein QC763_0064530 [Podospora pseudopauciseta]|uniref:Uncharacterized protein n=2 Tax=Podospora TaxID=5144 RepID=A0ABR0HCR5_9PEZI|nr:hypothetical protein QC763_0064530 [Podospora pseudopauciseta]KAK4676790.1 hypothetical protein QC764_0064070 [Podospora pseudoanserina]
MHCGASPAIQRSHEYAETLYKKPPVLKSCWECGMNCKDCIESTQRMCTRCGGGYCLIHNEGSDMISGV